MFTKRNKDSGRKSRKSRAKRQYQSYYLFFPAACLLAALAVPMYVMAVLTGSGWPPGLLGAGHGHELVFGFGLALVAGYTLGPQPMSELSFIFAIWLAARVTWIFFPEWPSAEILSPVFTLYLARPVVPRFYAAKKWRNRLTGPIIMVLCLAAVMWGLADPLRVLELPAPSDRSLLHLSVLGLLLLMTFMGGRIIAPAVAGTLEKRGIPLDARVQPRIEGALLITLSLTMITISFSLLTGFAALLLLVAGGLIVARTLRWKLWLCTDRPDLVVFGIGYLWLAAGSVVTGLALLTDSSPAASMHLITVGAMGTLSAGVMLRLYWQRLRKTPPPANIVWAVAILIAGATLTRLGAGSQPFDSPILLSTSATLWSITFLALTVHLLWMRARGKTQ